MKADIVQRIEKWMQIKKLNQTELSEILGYNSSEKISRLFRLPSAKPSYDIVRDISNKFDDLNIEWLITGKGTPLSKPVNIKGETQHRSDMLKAKDDIIDLQKEMIIIKDKRIKELEITLNELKKATIGIDLTV